MAQVTSTLREGKSPNRRMFGNLKQGEAFCIGGSVYVKVTDKVGVCVHADNSASSQLFEAYEASVLTEVDTNVRVHIQVTKLV